MKKQWIIAAVISVVLIAAGFAVGRSLWWVPLSKCSEVYRHYADSPDVSAAYIKDYRVNDTLTLSATVLQAVTDTGWAMLLSDFNVEPYPPEILELLGNNIPTEIKYVLHGTTNGAMDKVFANNDMVVISYGDHTITVIETVSSSNTYELFVKHVHDTYLNNKKQ